MDLSIIIFGGIILFAVYLLQGMANRCPSCRKLWQKENDGSKEVWSKKGYKTIERVDSHRNRYGEESGTTSRLEQVRIQTVKYENFHYCKACGYRWSTYSYEDYEDHYD